MYAVSTGTEPGLAASWSFNEELENQTATDVSAHGNHGVLGGNTLSVLPEATNPELTLGNVRVADAGTCSVRASNAAGFGEASATLTVSSVWLRVVGREPDGRPRLSLDSPAGAVGELLASTNVSIPLADWLVLTRLTNTTGVVSYTDPVTNLPRRFYRLRQVP